MVHASLNSVGGLNKLAVINRSIHNHSMKNNEALKLEKPLELMRKKGQWFQKMMKKNSVRSYIQAGKDCGYLVYKDDLEFRVNDDKTGELVMSGFRANSFDWFYNWFVLLSKKYWADPPDGLILTLLTKDNE